MAKRVLITLINTYFTSAGTLISLKHFAMAREFLLVKKLICGKVKNIALLTKDFTLSR